MVYYPSWYTLNHNLTLCFEKPPHDYIDNSDIDYPVRVILMQFTGLLDKNSKEIYEGDILWTYPLDQKEKGYGGAVLYGDYEITKYLPPEDNGDEIRDVTRVHGFHCSNQTIIDTFKFSELYVIGNVFENPHFYPVKHKML